MGTDEERRRANRHAMIGMIKYRLLKVAVVLGQSKHMKATKSRQQHQGNNIKVTTSRQQYQGRDNFPVIFYLLLPLAIGGQESNKQ